MKVGAVVIYVELEVGDGNPLFQEHLFVEGLHFFDFGGDAGVSGAVEVGRTGQGFKTVKLYYGLRILVEEAAVGLQMDVTLMLIDSDGTILENKHLTTAWVEPEGE